MALPPENARKTECEHGHPLSGDNLLIVHRKDGRIERVCRTCARARSRTFHAVHYVAHPRAKKEKPPPRLRPRRPRPKRPAYLRVLDRTEIIEGGCWLWQGAQRRNGYGVIQLGRGKGTASVHRVIYEHFVGPLPELPPPQGLDVMHTCHVRNCVNPGHLTLGTRAENMQASKIAGRLKRVRRP